MSPACAGHTVVTERMNLLVLKSKCEQLLKELSSTLSFLGNERQPGELQEKQHSTEGFKECRLLQEKE